MRDLDDVSEAAKSQRMAIERLLADVAGDAYDAETGARQGAAILTWISRHFIEADSVATLVGHAREHELTTVLDFIRSVPGGANSSGMDAVAMFVGSRAAVIVGGRANHRSDGAPTA